MNYRKKCIIGSALLLLTVLIMFSNLYLFHMSQWITRIAGVLCMAGIAYVTYTGIKARQH